MSRQDKRPSWILRYRDRPYVSKKYKDTEKQIDQCKHDGDWDCVKKLKRLLRNAWWGVRRYNKK